MKENKAIEARICGGKLRVLFVSVPGSKFWTVQATIGVGSANEFPQEAGIAHLLEHMAYLGSKKRIGKEVMIRDLDALGAVWNGETSYYRTEYYGMVLPGSGMEADLMDLMADLTTHATIPDALVSNQRNIIFREINNRLTDASVRADIFAQRAMYDNSAIARPVIGTRETLLSFDGTAIQAFQAKHYTTGNMILAVAGPFRAHGIAHARKKRCCSCECLLLEQTLVCISA